MNSGSRLQAKISLLAGVLGVIAAFTFAVPAALAACNWVINSQTGHCADPTDPIPSCDGGNVGQQVSGEFYYGSCNTTMTCTCTPENGVCGTGPNSTSYVSPGATFSYGSSNYGSYAQCSGGTSTNTAFPSAGNSVTWTCSGLYGGSNSGTCKATQAGAPPTISVSVSPSSVPNAGTFTVSMSSSGATSCTYTRTGTYSNNFNNQPVPPPETAPNTSFSYTGQWPGPGNATFSFTCTNAWGSASGSGSVTIAAPTIDLTAGAVSPNTGSTVSSTDFSATITNSGTGATGSGFVNLFQKATSSGGANATDIGTSPVGVVAANGGTAVATLSYTFPAGDAGTTKYLRVCADKSAAADQNGSINESAEGNNCGPWTAVTVSSQASPPSVDIHFE